MVIGRKITVLGAGIGGLAVARALALRGAEVTVLEQADAIREVGAGLQVSPNGARVLRALRSKQHQLWLQRSFGTLFIGAALLLSAFRRSN